ncbi:hypothetical protein AMS68_004760 [Peltaster fructicola]|uniref:Pre-rRNA-processing protein IPI3 n=1 Tax=Peltaster fructicola TaxID=286661 RepID=A0A6H0XWW8_9PEZI|nr:hypothetical protein AMS68_004760 [Peltaster fructicola]
MLVESLVVSLGATKDTTRIDPTKDASVIEIEYQPVVQQRASFKKSSTAPHCLATSSTHIFTAQADKAVVHVYNRSKGNQEATVPFTEKITCITLACDDTVLALGTTEGKLFLWEIATGRQITTAQSHLQAITCLAVDDSNFLVSSSADATARVWSLPALLSFQSDVQSAAPITTFDAHRSGITAVALGHSANLRNYAITISEDKTCLVWDYHTASTFFTFLLVAVPRCVDFDPADRAAYVGYEDGSVQQLDLLSIAKSRTRSGDAIQLGEKKRWKTPDSSHGTALALAVSFDGTTVLSGHQSGAIIAWDVANGHMRSLPLHSPFTRPVTSLRFLPIAGMANEMKHYNIETIVKPKFGVFHTTDYTVPGNYAAQLHLNAVTRRSSFQEALAAPTIPQSWLDEGLNELAGWSQPDQPLNGDRDDDFMAFEDSAPSQDLQRQNQELKKQIQALRRVQTASFDHIDKLSEERKILLQREQQRMLNNVHDED